jgi:hypothetical protein
MAHFSTGVRATAARATGMKLARFPVTILLSIQLAAMVVIPAMIKGTEPLALMTGICAVAVLVALYVELLARPLRPSRHQAKPVTVVAAFWVLAIGMLATIVATLGGSGSYAVQLGLAVESPLVSIAAPFTLWILFGTAMVFWLCRSGALPRSAGYWTLAAVGAMYLWEGLSRAILGQSAALILTVLILAVFTGLLRLRTIVIAIALIPLIWPPIYELRDALRRATATGPGAVSADSPLERLQLDTQMSYIARLASRPGGLEAPDIVTLFRIGLVPGFLDPGRPALDTGSRMNVALGGVSTSSQSATMLGNLYIFEGWTGVILFSLILALVMAFLVRRNNPWALAAIGLVYSSGMSFNATYPDVIPRVLQGLLSMLVAYGLVRLLSGPRARAAAADRRARKQSVSQQ